MRFKLTIFLIVFVGAKIFSQELSSAGASYLHFFNASIEKLSGMDSKKKAIYEVEIDKAKYNLKQIASSDPSYNQSDLKNKLKPFEDKLAALNSKASSDAKEGESTIAKLEEFLLKNIDEFSPGNSSSNSENMEKAVTDFEQAFLVFCSNELANSSSKKQAMQTAEDGWRNGRKDPSHVSSMENYSKREENSEWAVFNYYYMKLIYAKWSNLSKTFSESEELAEVAKSVETVYKKLGSKEAAEKGANKAKADHLAKIKLDPASASDPALEAQIKKALGNTKFGEGKTVLKVNLHNKDWNIKRNELTGVILSRSKNFSAVVKEKDGSCILIRYTSYKQDYTGGNYGNGYVYMGQADKMLCENVDK